MHLDCDISGQKIKNKIHKADTHLLYHYGYQKYANSLVWYGIVEFNVPLDTV